MKRKTLMSQNGRVLMNVDRVKKFSMLPGYGFEWSIFADDTHIATFNNEEDAEIEFMQIAEYIECEDGSIDLKIRGDYPLAKMGKQ